MAHGLPALGKKKNVVSQSVDLPALEARNALNSQRDESTGKLDTL